MASRDSLTRLTTLYAGIEQMRSLEVQVANSRRNDVECASTLERALRQSHRSVAREALLAGDRVGWQIAETAGTLAGRNLELIEHLYAESESKLKEAQVKHRSARLQWKQVQRVAEQAEEEVCTADERRTQAAADDRFASQRAWSPMKYR